MKKLKSLIIIAVCAVIAVLSFSGCDSIFGHDGLFGKLAGSNSGGCRHEEGGYVGSDETTHYNICVTCGEKYNIEEHTLNFGHDDKSHYNYCVWCEYRLDVQPHTYGEWSHSLNQSYRRCTHEYCRYKDECTHIDQHYTVTDEKHYFTCDNCEYDFTNVAHIYNKYCSFTETAHLMGCVCGKLKGETQPHHLEYKSENGTHWQNCDCGYETARAACSYGNYLYNKNVHYRICSVCNIESDSESHSMYMSLDRERCCHTCDYIKQPESLLVGTWEFTYNKINFVLILSSDWTYVLKRKSSGEIEGQGDYNTSRYDNQNGTVDGTIYLSADRDIQYKFAKGETDKFRDEYSYYFKK